MSRYIWITGLCITLIFARALQAQQPAFPGADGWGKYTTGGRGGEVIEVSNLYDSGQGSLRSAIQASGPRTIVFRVSGTIFLKSDLKISNGDLTIAGQTAPGDGICLANYPLRIEATNVIVRYIRSRLGDVSNQEKDALSVDDSDSIIIDHCTFSWSVDETASAYTNKNFTMQYCIISESLYNSVHSKYEHGYGGIWGGSKASFHHNLIAHHTSRLPRFNGARYSTNWDELVDHRNNVIYNWGFNSAYGGEPSEKDGNIARINVVKNYYKAGPATQSGEKQYRIVDPDPDPKYGYSDWYVDSNEIENYPDASEDNWLLGVQGVSEAVKLLIRSDTVFPFMMDYSETASEAYIHVLDDAGANIPRQDTIDRRIIWEVKNGTATYGGTFGAATGIIDSQEEVGSWPALFTAPAPPDRDHDGMPDQWEISKGLDPDDPDDRNNDQSGNGYTNLEDYLSGIVPWGDFIRPPTGLDLELSGLNHVNLSWVDNSEGESGYYLERASAGDFEVIDTLPPDVIQYADSNLAYETTYSYRLRAFSAADSSAYTNINTITTLAETSAPNKAFAPSPAHYENNVSVNPVIQWIAGEGTEYHRIYFGTSNPPEFYGEQAENSFSPGPLDYNQSYYWKIDEVNANGTTEGLVWKFITEESTGFEEITDLPFDIYPNPITNSTAILEYYSENQGEFTISLYDMFGRKIPLDYSEAIPGNVGRLELNLSNVPSGTYILMLQTEKSYRAVRIIISVDK
jgi:hypothetical protein